MAAFVIACSVSGCPGYGQYIWFERLPRSEQILQNEYFIAIGDMVEIRVFGHDEMAVHQRVRPDGRLALFLIGEIEAKGKRPSALRAEVEGRLKDYIVSPTVVVNIDETQPLTILLLGEVGHPGAVSLERDPRLSHAIALAGGLTEFASRDSIFVVREQPAPMRIRFRYDAITRNVGQAGDFQLHSGDVVEVE
jgi:polysaccharide export outer membrane protein